MKCSRPRALYLVGISFHFLLPVRWVPPPPASLGPLVALRETLMAAGEPLVEQSVEHSEHLAVSSR